MKLYVDDIRTAPHGWHTARTVTEAIRLLATWPDIEEVSLDHDASHGLKHGDDVAEGCPNDFTAVAYFIKEKFDEDFIEDHVHIHSANPEGVAKIKHILYG